MIIVGAPNVILPVVHQNPGRFVVYNISSNLINPDIQQLNLQYMQNMDYTQKDVDIAFANMILGVDAYFGELMRIILPLRDGLDVALLVYREESFFDASTESLMKLIQQRYGYNYQLLNDVGDFNPWDQSSFDINGTFNLDRDSERYLNILANINPKMFVDEKIDDSHF